MTRAAAVVVLVGVAAVSTPSGQVPIVYDLLLKNGRVFDAAAGTTTRADVAIAGGKIARIAPDVPSHQARTTVDVSAYYVTPGLIDLHTYVNAQRVFRDGDPRAGWRGVNADHNALRNGVTTVVDAGSTGWRTFDRFKTLVVDRSRVRVLAFLNVLGAGIDEGRSAADPKDIEVQPTVEMARRHADTIVGIRSPHVKGTGLLGIERTVAAAAAIGRAALVEHLDDEDFAWPQLLLERLRPGDIVTHAFGSTTPLLDSGAISQPFAAARQRGVLFDLGHGTKGFSFHVAAPAVRHGFLPDVISTAMDKESLLLPRANMMTTLSKLLNLGVPLEQLLQRVTARPSLVIGRPELGTLREGAVADIAVIEVQQGRFGFLDASRQRLNGTQQLQTALTIREGRVVWDSKGLSRADWTTAGPYTNWR